MKAWIILTTKIFCLISLLLVAHLFAHSRDPKFHQISVDEGLSHISVKCILQDQEGFMWFGTENGLNRYDGYSFRIYKSNALDSTSISDNSITSICQSDPWIIWVGTKKGGLNLFDKRTNKFQRIRHQSDNKNSLSNDCIQSLYMEGNGNIWIGTQKGLNVYDPVMEKFHHYFHDPEKQNGLNNDNILKIIKDESGIFWIGTKGGGLNKYDSESKTFSHYMQNSTSSSPMASNTINDIYYEDQNTLWLATESEGLCRFDITQEKFLPNLHNPADQSSIASNTVNSIHLETMHRKNLMWLGTSGGGINVFDKQTKKFIRHKCDLNTLCCLGTNTIHTIFEDHSGIIWVGTDCCGLNKFKDTYMEFVHYNNPQSGFEHLQHDKIWVFLEDDFGFLWIATSHGLKRLNLYSGEFKTFNHIYSDPHSLSNDEVTSIFEGKDNTLWIGTEDGLNWFDKRNNTFQLYKRDPFNLNSLSDNSIITMTEDRRGNLWIGTKFGGLNKLNPQRNIFKHFKHDPKNPNSMANTAVMTIVQSATTLENELWIGTFNGGLLKFNTEKEIFTHYLSDPGNPKSISNNTINAIYEDSEGIIWIGTGGGGLNRFDKQTESFDKFSIKDGLLDNTIHTIERDDHGNLWLGTPKGLSRFNIESGQFSNFHFGSEPDFDQYSYNALYRNQKGKFYYGTSNGYITFDPDSLGENMAVPPVVITGIKVLNEEISGDEFLTSTKSLELTYDQNFFSFEFSVLDYMDPPANQYSYMLEGVNPDWVYNQNLRTVSYTDIHPGEYLFKVKGANSAGIWNENGSTLSVIIHPPIWKTWWAYTAYALFFLAFLYGGQRTILKRERQRNRDKINRLQRKKLEEINSMKSRFFANISHEFRTPLSLILGPVEKLLQEISDPHYKQDLTLVHRNTKRLNRLINQLLDLSKLETGHMPLKVKPVDLVSFMKTIFLSFTPLAERKQISLHMKSDYESIVIYIDPDKMEKIMSNIISNALKFTDRDGEVLIRIKNSATCIRTHNNGQCVTISIADNGHGIPQKDLKNIFDRFYQVDHLHEDVSKGTGIGLSLVKELVELHKGKIRVSSSPGRGTIFSVILRLGKDHIKESDIKSTENFDMANLLISNEDELDRDKSENRTEKDTSNKSIKKAETILIVEDNKDVQQYLTRILQNDYNIISAINGKEGIDIAIEKIPDLIVSDVMMPEKDGFELCKKLKLDHMTSHIPIILLTAKATGEAKINGLERGADDYITKPFDTKEVTVRITNLIEQRKLLRKKYSMEPNLKLLEIVPTPLDAEFLTNALEIVEKYSDNPDFDVNMFCREAGMSRVQLHRKLRALTDKSTTEFIRKYRVRKAAKMMTQKSGIVFEIAYKVGFNNLSYFAKCFREEFGISPSEYIRQLANKN